MDSSATQSLLDRKFSCLGPGHTNLDGVIGTAWANWLLVGACGLSTVACLLYPESYRRLNVDKGKDYSIEAVNA